MIKVLDNESKLKLENLDETYTKLQSFYNNYEVFELLFKATGSVIALQNKLDLVLKAPINVLKSGLTVINEKWTTVLDQLQDLPTRNNVQERVKALIKEVSMDQFEVGGKVHTLGIRVLAWRMRKLIFCEIGPPQ